MNGIQTQNEKNAGVKRKDLHVMYKTLEELRNSKAGVY